jgi:hypothetical protein
MIFEKMISLVVGAGVALLILLCVYAVIQDQKHEEFLQAHGCQLLTKAPTGRTHLVGKLIEDEYVYVYECADGTRTEVE